MDEIGRSNRRQKMLSIAITFFICIAIRIVPAIKVFGTEDVYAVIGGVSSLEQGKSPYSQGFVFNQSPFWVNAIYQLNKILHLFNLDTPPYLLIKILPMICDGAIAVIIYLIFLNDLKRRNKDAVAASLFYALNPVSIMITSVHGNPVSIPAAFMLLSLYLFNCYKNSEMASTYCSSLALGVAIMSKIWPVFVLPLILQKIQGFKRRAIYSSLSILPLIISLAPLFFENKTALIRNFFQYQGVAWWWGFTGLGAIWRVDAIRAMAYFYALHGTKILAAAIFLLYFFKTARLDIYKGSLLICLGVLFFIPGFGPQYLIWLLPFAIITGDKMLYPFTLYAAVLLFVEYAYRPFLPGYFGVYVSPHPPALTMAEFVRDNRITNILRFPLWVFLCAWLIRMALYSRKEEKSRPGRAKAKS